MLPLPTSGSNDWANDGTAMKLSKVAIVRVFFISFSVFYFRSPSSRFPLPSIAFFEFALVATDPAPTQVPVIRSAIFAYLLRRAGTETFLRMSTGDYVQSLRQLCGVGN